MSGLPEHGTRAAGVRSLRRRHMVGSLSGLILVLGTFWIALSWLVDGVGDLWGVQVLVVCTMMAFALWSLRGRPEHVADDPPETSRIRLARRAELYESLCVVALVFWLVSFLFMVSGTFSTHSHRITGGWPVYLATHADGRVVLQNGHGSVPAHGATVEIEKKTYRMFGLDYLDTERIGLRGHWSSSQSAYVAPPQVSDEVLLTFLRDRAYVQADLLRSAGMTYARSFDRVAVVIIALGLGVGYPLMLVIFVVAWKGRKRYARLARSLYRRQSCQKCGYDLRGLDGRVCPECGEAQVWVGGVGGGLVGCEGQRGSQGMRTHSGSEGVCSTFPGVPRILGY